MNGTLITAFLRQRMTSPIRLVFLIGAMGFPLLFVAAAPASGFSALETSLNFALIFGAGMIGQDTASGVLQLLFARPVRRDVYAISRWFAASRAATVMAVVQVGLAALVLAARGARPEAGDVAIAWANHVTSAFGPTAPLLALSALVPGLGDLGLMLLIYVFAGILQMAGGAMNQANVSQLGHVMQDFLNPMIDFHQVLGPAISWNEIVSYLSTVTLSLALAIVVLNRKELSYASTS
jgi:ABC-type transport system involved in multi-copper enzyme maturation permease subunit